MFVYKNFINKIIDNDLYLNKYNIIRTRFSPEPSGFLHLGHVKSVFINYNLAKYYNGIFNLRFDDTNPICTNYRFVNSILNDFKWLNINVDYISYSSDYFSLIYNYAIKLICKGLAYVDELSIYKIKQYRGTLYKFGVDSPYRYRSVGENLKLFNDMKNGIFNEGEVCLRAKINMLSKNIVMRDPVIYRIKYFHHFKTGNNWCIYPMYDFSNCILDLVENITHSICTMEFQDNRMLYDWILNNVCDNNLYKSKQYEFCRLNIDNNIISKRKLFFLIKNNLINDWDDPRLLTISGLKRRGYTNSSIISFCNNIGVSKKNSKINISLLNFFLRKELSRISNRIMGVIDPIKIIILNVDNNYYKYIKVLNNPKDLNMGCHKVIFTKEIYIDKKDFCVTGININRFTIGDKVRLRNSFTIKAEFINKINNNIIIYCTCFFDSFKKKVIKKEKIKIINWVSAKFNVNVNFFIYRNLFLSNDINNVNNFVSFVNKKSFLIKNGFLELYFLSIKDKVFQLEREGYFIIDNKYRCKRNGFFVNKIINIK